MQVEVVADVVFIDLDEELVAFKIAEPTDPASSRLTVIIIIQIV